MISEKIIPVIENEKKELLNSLEQNLGSIKINQLQYLSEAIESFILQKLDDTIKKYSSVLWGLTLHEASCIFNYSRCHLFYTFACSIRKYEEMILTITSESEFVELKNVEISLDAYGRYKKLVFIYPEFLKIDPNATLGLIKTMFEVGYNWYFEQIDRIVASLEVSLADELYSYTRKIIYNKQLRDNLWFSSITDGYGFRLIGRDVSRSSFKLIDGNNKSSFHSTNRLVAELLNTRLPSNQLLMNQCALLKQCIDADMSNADYSKGDNIYGLTLAAFYDSTSFTIYPIYISDRFAVFCLFPTEHNKYLSEILSQHSNELTEVILRRKSDLIKSLNTLNGRKSWKFSNLKELNDIVILNPNFFGFGIDLNSLIKKLSKIFN